MHITNRRSLIAQVSKSLKAPKLFYLQYFTTISPFGRQNVTFRARASHRAKKTFVFLIGGSGISEPITAQTIVNREGFGTKSASHMFKRKIRQIIEEYAASSNPYDLVFTSGFDNEQRKEMHL